MELTSEHEKLLRHTLGADPHIRKSKWGFRNRFVSTKGGRNYEAMREMQLCGLVEEGWITDKFIFFRATLEGCKAIKLTKTQIARAFEDKS